MTGETVVAQDVFLEESDFVEGAFRNRNDDSPLTLWRALTKARFEVREIADKARAAQAEQLQELARTIRETVREEFAEVRRLLDSQATVVQRERRRAEAAELTAA